MKVEDENHHIGRADPFYSQSYIDSRGESLIGTVLVIGGAALSVWVYNNYIATPPDPDDVLQSRDIFGVRNVETGTFSLGLADTPTTFPEVGYYYQYDQISDTCFKMYRYDVDVIVSNENYVSGQVYTMQEARIRATEDRLGDLINYASTVSSAVDIGIDHVPGLRDLPTDRLTDIADSIILGADVSHRLSGPESGFTWEWRGESFQTFSSESTFTYYHITESIKWDTKYFTGDVFTIHYEATEAMLRLNEEARPNIDSVKAPFLESNEANRESYDF